MKPGTISRRRQRQAKTDAGMAMGMALTSGFVLALATSGLVAKQLMSRRVGTSEGYQQLAELAASNGMNRILAALNDKDTNISHFWKLSQSDPNAPIGTPLQQWDLTGSQLRKAMAQPCADNSSSGSTPNVLFGGDLSNGYNLKDNGRQEPVQISYSLRSYNYSAGDRKAIVAVEGYATAGNSDNAKILGRSLVTRVIALQDQHNSHDDWGVIAARSMQLGASKVFGEGRVLWMLNQQQADKAIEQTACNTSDLAKQLGIDSASTASRVWLLSSTTAANPEFPSAEILDQQTSIDRIDSNLNSERRLWSINDNRSLMCNGGPPPSGSSGDAICTRGESQRDWVSFDSGATVQRAGGRVKKITLHSEDICKSTPSRPCSLLIESIRLNSGATLSVETSSADGNRPVVLRMLKPEDSIELKSGQLCQAKYRQQQSNPLPCQSADQSTASNLVILATGGSKTNSCIASGQRLTFGDKALASALVIMPQGTVKVAQPASMRGVVWAHNICADKGLSLSTTEPDGRSVIQSFQDTWLPHESLTFGRTITRGIRRTGLDRPVNW